jgi:hypothetical protein
MSAVRAYFRRFSSFSLDSKDFATMRARGSVLVDKTGAIADLLSGTMEHQSCVFFARPRKFGKSLTLSIAAEMLAAGPLPRGVAPWPGYAPADARALFGGLQVHERLLRGDASLGSLLQRPHFVVKLGLGGATSGAKLEAAIFDEIAVIADKAFGEALKKEVRLQATPLGALGALVNAVPSAVPVALLVDEYDAAIIQDVSEGDWVSAKAGIKALRSLAMSTKSPHFGSRIERCLITGVARFAHTSLFSGANNFADLTGDPLLSRVLGFSESEIRATFPEELARLAGGLGTDVDGAVAQLAHWYNGYCFDGASTCFNPFPVLSALRAGVITQREMQAASGINWLGLTPGDLVHSLAAELGRGTRSGSPASFDIADLEGRRVRAVPLLLQTGLLTVEPGQVQRCHPPNEYARASLQAMLTSALAGEDGWQQCTLEFSALFSSLSKRSPAAFSDAAAQILRRVPCAMFKGSKAAGGSGGVRESGYHAALAGALVAGAPQGVRVELEASSMSGRADIVVRFGGGLAWVLEIGVGRAGGTEKLLQAQAYGCDQSESEVLCCSVVVAPQVSASAAGGATRRVDCAWSKRVKAEGAGGTTWCRL